MTERATNRQLVTLAEEEALELLATTPVARMAYLLDDEICVIPVNFSVDGTDVYVRTSEGSELMSAARGGQRATFQADGISDWSHTGWSVLLVGRLLEVTDFATIDHVIQELEPWTGGRAHVVRLVGDRVTGRRILPTAGGVHLVSHH